MGSAMIAAAGVPWPPSRSAEYHHPCQPARGHRGLLLGQSVVSLGARGTRGVVDSCPVYNLARTGAPALRVLAVCVAMTFACWPAAARPRRLQPARNPVPGPISPRLYSSFCRANMVARFCFSQASIFCTSAAGKRTLPSCTASSWRRSALSLTAESASTVFL